MRFSFFFLYNTPLPDSFFPPSPSFHPLKPSTPGTSLFLLQRGRRKAVFPSATDIEVVLFFFLPFKTSLPVSGRSAPSVSFPCCRALSFFPSFLCCRGRTAFYEIKLEFFSPTCASALCLDLLLSFLFHRKSAKSPFLSKELRLSPFVKKFVFFPPFQMLDGVPFNPTFFARAYLSFSHKGRPLSWAKQMPYLFFPCDKAASGLQHFPDPSAAAQPLFAPWWFSSSRQVEPRTS